MNFNFTETKLMMMEGLPSTGKSTNSSIIFSKLEQNGYIVKWIHEIARPHPTLFFYEACLEQYEFEKVIRTYPHTVPILNKIKRNLDHFICIDLLEIEWNHLELFREDALNALKKYDAWNFSLKRFMKVALEKWKHFATTQLQKTNEVIILDSSIFQFQIYTFLLENAPFDMLSDFIQSLYKIIKPLEPTMVYLYRDNFENTIEYLIKDRGIDWLNGIWERDKHLPYYQGKPLGVEGYKLFLRDYENSARRLFNQSPFNKLSLEITGGKWDEYVDQLLSFLNISFSQTPKVSLPYQKFFNSELNKVIEIYDDIFITPNGEQKRLSRKNNNEFYLNNIPVIIRLEEDQVVFTGEQLCERWTSTGTIFQRVN